MSTILNLRQEPKTIFNIHKLKPAFKDIEKYLLRMNSEWREVQALYLLSHYLISNIEKIEKNNLYKNIVPNSFVVLIKDYYIHFSIIYKILEKNICNECQHKIIKDFFKSFKNEFEYKIQVARNQVIIHKEMEDFRDPLMWVLDTGRGGMSLSITVIDKNKTTSQFELRPFYDVKKIEEHLLALKAILERGR